MAHMCAVGGGGGGCCHEGRASAPGDPSGRTHWFGYVMSKSSALRVHSGEGGWCCDAGVGHLPLCSRAPLLSPVALPTPAPAMRDTRSFQDREVWSRVFLTNAGGGGGVAQGLGI